MGMPDSRALTSCRSSMGLKPTISGTVVNHNRNGPASTIFGMEKNDKPAINNVLWENVRTLMIRDYGKENLQLLQKKVKIGGGAGRLKEQKTSPRIATLQKLADHFRVEVWQLLVSGLNDVKFIDVVRTWNDTDERGRRMIYNAVLGAQAEDEPEQHPPADSGRDRASGGVQKVRRGR